MPYAKVNNIDLYYEIHGEGEPFIEIFGGGGTIESTYPGVQHPLSKEYQVVVYDHRSSGKSDKSDKPLSMELLADDVAGLLDSIGIESAHVRGFSKGGMIAQHLALKYPNRIRSLILGCTSCQFNTDYTHAIQPPQEFMDLFNIVKAQKLSPEEYGIRLARLQMTDEYEKEHPDVFKQMSEAIANDSQRLIQTRAEHLCVHDTYDRLPEIQIPTLVISGNGDKIISYKNSEILASRIPNAELAIIDGAGHTFIEAREEIMGLTLDFLRRHSNK